METTTKTAVTINVTIADGSGSAPDSDVHLGDTINWMVGGDVQPGDEVRVHRFRQVGGNGPSPMRGGDDKRTRKGKGPIEDGVRDDAQTGTYTYDVTLVRAGVASVLDPQIQIKP